MNHIFMYIDNELALRQIVAPARAPTELLEMCCLHTVLVRKTRLSDYRRPTITLKVQIMIFIKLVGIYC